MPAANTSLRPGPSGALRWCSDLKPVDSSFAPTTDTVYVSEFLDVDALYAALVAKYVRCASDGSGATVWNYTENATFDRYWTPETLACRGLITEGEGADLRVLARPFGKFFNWGEIAHNPDVTALMVGPVVVADKMDGSLGVIYHQRGRWRVSTRGSLVSKQAQHATDVLQDYLSDGTFQPEEGTTYLAEIIFPQNRIVLNYGTQDRLVLLGTVNNRTGHSDNVDSVPENEWAGHRAEIFPFNSLEAAAESVDNDPRPNAEGVVVHWPQTGLRVKLKQADYIARHSAKFNLSERSVWEAFSTGSFETMVRESEEEFRPWIEKVHARMTADVDAIIADVKAVESVIDRLAKPKTRAEFIAAMEVYKSAIRPGWKWSGFLTSERSGFNWRPNVWKEVYPEHVPFAGDTLSDGAGD
jgi:RNA ligase